MRRLLPILVLAGFALSGCVVTRGIPVHTSWDSPRQSFETFRDALEAGASNVVYDSLSPGFKEKYGVPGFSKFKIGYEAYREEFDGLAAVLREARPTEVRYEESGGRLYAFVSLVRGDARGDFVLVDLPGWEAVVDFPDYPPELVRNHLPGRDLSDVVLVKDGRIYLGPFDAEALGGVQDASEILRLSVQHRWLLEDIRRLVNVGPLLERIGMAPPGP